ncbi:hypothetical protein IC620_16115 [Hazenella sp. IB182357]|uniref:Uncharacterized protein n=1 Tax=Polycladospora coralii TaxID=2771432 RepID=A0A926NDL3_9BACL|nr:hypothetical protein [Polycladospora coralii]MBD1373870.1 hypothetical protein [Polycladospora coralii]
MNKNLFGATISKPGRMLQVGDHIHVNDYMSVRITAIFKDPSSGKRFYKVDKGGYFESDLEYRPS